VVNYTGYDFGDVPSRPPADTKTRDAVRQFLAWKKKNHGFMPTDAINILIDSALITKSEVEELMKETPPLPVLPTNHIS
jgi:hypothetical protein